MSELLPISTNNDVLVIVPSRSRPASCRALADTVLTNSTRADLLLALDADDPLLPAYRGIPGSLYEPNPRQRLVGTLNLLANKYAEQYRYLAILADTHRIRTPHWDQILVEAIADVPHGIAYGADLRPGAPLPSAVLLSTSIVRTLGFLAPPALVHHGTASFWRDLGQALGTLRFCRHVLLPHLAPQDRPPEPALPVPTDADEDPELIAQDLFAYARYRQHRLPVDIARLSNSTGKPVVSP